MELIDTGVNLTNERFDEDRDEVIARAIEASVRAMIVTGTSVEESRAALTLAQTRPGVLFATAGVHPHDASGCDDATIGALRELAAHDAVVAIGECGLDFNRDRSPRAAQERWFEAQVELAAELSMPLFLHERDAQERFLALLDPHLDDLGAVVVHCFTGDEAALAPYVERDFYIGVTGWICDERRGQGLRDCVGKIPLNRLMIETDAPYLTPRDLSPQPRRGRNEPAYLPHILKAIAGRMSVSPEGLAAAILSNTRRCFGLPRRERA